MDQEKKKKEERPQEMPANHYDTPNSQRNADGGIVCWRGRETPSLLP